MRPDPDLLQRWVIRDGVPPSQIGARLGLSRAAGYSWLHRYGITPDGPILSQRRLVARWRQGRPQRGLTPEAVRERLIAAAVLTPARSYFLVGGPDDPLPEHLLREWCLREGYTVAKVAALTGTTARQVRYRLTRYGLRATTPNSDASTGDGFSSASGSGRHSLIATTPGSTGERSATNESNSARVRG
jgi:hypothetical protein